jgi:hypothetical protein
MSTALPAWTDRNLARHHAERLRKDPGCFEDLLGVTGRSLTIEEYRDRSVQAVTNTWCEYEAQGRNFALSTYLESRIYYVDDDLVVAITDGTRSLFVTCFHEHFDGRQSLHGRHPGRGASVAQRRILYREDLRVKEQGRVIINLKVIHDG